MSVKLTNSEKKLLRDAENSLSAEIDDPMFIYAKTKHLHDS